MKLTEKQLLAFAGVAAGAAFLAWWAWPKPIPVDFAVVTQQTMVVTVDEEARTRVRHIYTVSAPVSGAVLRARLDVGDGVKVDDTVVAVMRPAASGFHDARLHQELLAAAAAADAAVGLADAERRGAAAALAYAKSEFARIDALAAKGIVSRSALDKVTSDLKISEAGLASAAAAVQIRRKERESAVKRLQSPGDIPGQADIACCITLRSPVTGQVLRRFQESEATVPAGTPLVELGDPWDLEIVAELLSTDAVQVRAGAPVRIDGWGGAAVAGRVRRIEPAGFQKISALGIEEQRVRTIIDFTEPPERWRQLGHDYRVTVHVETWSADKALTVPVGALFRSKNSWAVYKGVHGRARLTPISIGQRNGQVAQVLTGLVAGDQVVMHPNDRVSEGVRIAPR